MSDREAFEKWCGTQESTYHKSGMWQAWQAAQAQAVNQQLLEALKSCEQCLTFIHGGEPLRADIPLQLARAAIAAAQEQK